MVELGEVAEMFIDGDWIESKDQSDTGIRLIQTGNVGFGEYLDKGDKARFITDEKFKELNCTEVFEGDVLISRLPDPVGRACLVPKINSRMITAVDCTIVRFNPNKLMSKLFVNLTKTENYYKNIFQYLTGASRQRISRSNLYQIKIPLPPLSVQQEIVAEIEGYQKIIDGARQVGENYKPKIKVDERWEVVELGEVSENLDSKRKPVTKSDRKNGPYPYYGASGIVDYVDDFIFNEDLLLISEDGANLISRNTPIAFSIGGKTWVNNHAHILRFKNIETQKFVEFYLNSINLENYITGCAQPKINQEKLNKMPIPLPPLDVQKEIVARIEEEQKLVDANKKLIELFEGKIKEKIAEVWG